MDWTDSGLVLTRRRHGESAAIVTLLTRAHGRHAGLVRGGSGKRGGALWQPGNLVSSHWRARLAEHLGSLTGEMAENFAARALDDPLRLAALSSACALLDTALYDREPHPELFDATVELMRALDGAGSAPEPWAADYACWEMRCLAEFGFGLDLESCAVTGGTDDLAFVSPRTGRAVSTAAGRAYADRLFPLPRFLAGDRTAPADARAIAEGLRLTGHFLERYVLSPHERRMPAARTRFIDRWRRFSTISGKISN